MPHYGLTQEGAAIALRVDSTVTSSYVASNAIDLKSYDSVTIGIDCGTTSTATVSNKFQWSMDTSVATPLWYDEGVITNGTASGGEQPQTSNSKRVDVVLTTAGTLYIARFHRLARYLRVVSKSASVTTGTIRILAKPSVNFN